MKAIEIKEKYLNKEDFGDFSVIAISQNAEDMHYFHVHEDEEVPEYDYDIALKITVELE